MTPVSGIHGRDDEFVIVPRRELRELASLEGNLRKERRSFVADCEHLVANARLLPDARYPLAEPSPVATVVLVATCDREVRRCEATVAAMFEARRSEAMKERAVRATARETLRSAFARPRNIPRGTPPASPRPVSDGGTPRRRRDT
mmetsp:Transcript_14413/g.44517  ORF Transcript_14413/g.44517 Transcript_14413/m.44517 type:complete len:146 (+) Transcript_14413:806-1243(+)